VPPNVGRAHGGEVTTLNITLMPLPLIVSTMVSISCQLTGASLRLGIFPAHLLLDPAKAQAA
jgi:hypothetical protein